MTGSTVLYALQKIEDHSTVKGRLNMVPTLSDSQISLTYSAFFALFEHFLKFFFYLGYVTIFAVFSLLLA